MPRIIDLRNVTLGGKHIWKKKLKYSTEGESEQKNIARMKVNVDR